MELNLFVKELFSKAQEEGFSEYEVYYVDRESLSISVYKEEVEKYNLNNSAGLSFRGKFGDRIGYSYTEILDEDAIEMLVKKAKENVLAIENNDIQFIYEGDKEYKEISTYHEELEDIPADKLINIAISMEKEAKKYCNKVESFSGCSVSYSSGKYGIINSKGLNLSNKSNLLTAYVVPIVKDLDKMYDGCGYVVAKSLNDVKPDKIAKMGVDEALSKIGGTSIASGNYKVIINNEAMVSLLSTFAGIFSGDAVQKGLSLLKDKEGEYLKLSYLSKDGEENYPGNLEVVLEYRLSNENELIIKYFAKSDKDTIVNLTNHSYFNLSGHASGDILNHKVKIYATNITASDKESIPTGEIRNIIGTPLDFTKLKEIGRDINKNYDQLINANGYDHNWIIDDYTGSLKKAAEVADDNSGRVLEVFTTKPGIQFYTGNFLNENEIGKGGVKYRSRQGLCLETQYFPDSLNHKGFSNVILKAGEEYNHTTIYKVSIKNK